MDNIVVPCFFDSQCILQQEGSTAKQEEPMQKQGGALSSLLTLTTAVSYAKTVEPIEMQFGMWTRLGPSKHM